MKNYLFILFALFVFFGCVNSPPSNYVNSSNSSSTPNNATISTPVPLPSDYSISLGDKVLVDYTLYVDGQILDTTNSKVATEAGIFNPKKSYQPFGFTVEFNKGIIDGFIINIIGLKLNESESFVVDPSRGYGFYDPKKVSILPRYYNKTLYEQVPMSYFVQNKINVSNGSTFSTPYGDVFVTDIQGENVTIFYLLKKNQQFSVKNLPQKVVNLSDFNATIEFDLKENKSYTLPDPQTGAPLAFKVIAIGDDTISIDSNHPLANKTLKFNVTVVGIQSGAKAA